MRPRRARPHSPVVANRALPGFFNSWARSRRYTCPPCLERALGVVMDSMEKIVSLCKRRGFIFPSSEIYGGLNGAWDYGPLGVELKRNLKQAWWDDMVAHHDETATPPGAPQPFGMVGLDSALLMNPKVWEASGHVGGFSDPMVDEDR